MGKLTGKKVALTFDSKAINVTKCSQKVSRELSDSTDSGDYDATSDLIHKTQLAHTIGTDLSIEGYWYTDATTGTADALLKKCYSGMAAAAGTVKLDGTNTNFSGNWDIADFEADVPTDDTVSFKCTLKSNGVIAVS